MLTNIQQKQIKKIRAMTNIIDKSKRYEYDIKNLKINSYVSINDEIFIVEELSIYKEVKWSSFKEKNNPFIINELKLFSLKNGRTMYVEWSFDDKIEIYQTVKEVKFKDIKYDGRNINSKDLEEISENEFGYIQYENISYAYDDNETMSAKYTSDRFKNVKMRMYEFYSTIKDENLTLEVWYDSEKSEKEGYISKEVLSSNIEVLKI